MRSSPAVAWFFGVPARGQTWRNVAYLALTFPLGVAYLVILAVGLSTGAALAVLVVGLAILVATLAAWRSMATLERTLARALLRVRVASPHPPPENVSALRRLAGWLRDPVTWKSLVFLIAKLPMGVVALVALAGLGGTTLTIAAAPVLTTFTPVTVFGWELGSPGEALPLLVPGLLGVLLCLHLYNGLAWLYGLAARAMLGPGTAELHYRVDDLRDARARLIEAADAERRRIERDLHDGAQQRLVALALTLKVAETKVDDPAVARPLLVQARQEAEQANRELRELARGIHPAVLSDRGLGPALDALAARAPIPVEVSGVPAERLPPAVEAAAYFTTAEALTNVAKYAGAEEARVQLAVNDGRLSLSIADDGKGGAELERGSGLRGLRDRVEAVDGTFAVHSPPGQGTVIVAEIPLERP